MHVESDERFRRYFSNLKQVFLYLTDQCNLSCNYCLYKPNLVFHPLQQVPLEAALALIAHFRELGASKLTVRGGGVYPIY